MVAPGSTLVAFLLWRYPNVAERLESLNPAIVIIALILAVLTLGVTWYAIHRTLMRYLWRKIELALGGVPQYQFHRKILDEITSNKKIRDKANTLSAAEDCSTNVLKKAEERREILLLNTLVHILLMNSELAAVFLIHDLSTHLAVYPLIGVYFALIWLFAIFGIALDKEADEKIVAILREMSGNYKKILRHYIKYLNP